jgi:hypothetical protein
MWRGRRDPTVAATSSIIVLIRLKPELCSTSRRLDANPRDHRSPAPDGTTPLLRHASPPSSRPRLLFHGLKKLNSPRVASIEPEAARHIPALDAVLDRDAAFRFLIRARSFLASLPPPHRIPLSEAGKLFRELGFPCGRSVSRAAARHTLLFHLPVVDSVPHLALTPFMCSLLEEERRLHEELLPSRVRTVRKLLMLTTHRRVPLAKLHHCRMPLGLPDDFRVAVDPDDRNVLELVRWDPALAFSALERDFVVDERRVRRTFRFAVPHRRSMPLDAEDSDRLDAVTMFPLVSPYTNGALLKPWTPDAEEYRVGVVHEFLSLDTGEARSDPPHLRVQGVFFKVMETDADFTLKEGYGQLLHHARIKFTL